MASPHDLRIAKYNASRYSGAMIQGFADSEAELILVWASNPEIAGRYPECGAEKAASSQVRVLGDLRVPPGNRLEALRADRQEQHSIRINDQWRICFIWNEEGPSHVEIVDYHC